MAETPDNADTSNQPVSLDAVRSGKFFQRLASDPFLCIVVSDEGEVVIYGKDLEESHIERIREVLREVSGEQIG